MDKSAKIQSLVLIVGIGFIVAVIFHSIMGLVFHTGYPQNTFLFRANDRFMDFINPLRGSFDLDPYNPERIYYIGGYFPVGYFVAFLYSRIKPLELSLGIFIGTFLIYLLIYIYWYVYKDQEVLGKSQKLKRLAIVFILAYLSYPVIFVVDRANFDIVIFFLVTLALLLYEKGQYVFCVILLSLATAMKGYPAFLFGLFLVDRRFKEFALACLLVPAITMGTLAVFKGGLVVEFSKMLVSFQSASSIAFSTGSLVRFNSSLYTAMIFLFEKVKPDIAISPKFNLAYLVMMVFGYLFTLVMMWRKQYPFWAKVTILTAAMILLFQSSGDYRLIMLYPSLLLFLNSSQKRKVDPILVGLFGLLLIPKAYFLLREDVNIGLLVNPLLLGILLAVTLFTRNISSSGDPVKELAQRGD